MEIITAKPVETLTSSVRRNVARKSLAYYTGLLEALLRDVACVCYQSDVELEKDIAVMRSRSSDEGMSFLTRTLPSLGKAVDLALASDTNLDTSGFKLSRGTKIPRFMRDVFLLVFDADGRERSDASPLALKCLRQMFYLFYKLDIPSTEEQNNEVIASFIRTDAEIQEVLDLSDHRLKWIVGFAGSLVKRVLAPTSPLDARLFRPRHGPGSVSTGEKPWQKPFFKRYYKALSLVFPYEEYFYHTAYHLADDLRQFLALPELEHGTAKVVLVPKDSRGPRLISCEPLEFQWIQQGVAGVMTRVIESHPYTAGHVNFTDQTVNQRLALDSSLTRRHATLDMKEASDRVSVALVKELFPSEWTRALLACRSAYTLLPNGEALKLRKFAPMGSACCFPVEALVFWALCVATVSYRLPANEHEKARKSVYVYGDDIICNSEDQAVIRQTLPLVGLVFNEQKCCTGNSFRESCGVDAFKGVDVTPLKIKTVWSLSLAGTDYASFVENCNSMNARGYFNASDYMTAFVQRVRVTPYSESQGSSVITLVDARKTASQENRRLGFRTRMHPRYQYLEINAWKVRGRTVEGAAAAGWAEVQRIASYTPLGSNTPGGLIASSPLKEALRRLAPDIGYTLSSRFKIPWVEEAMLVRAYQYALPRRVTLRRGWGRL